ncbi:aldehyde ferredoxin oxidoreductase family protein [Thermovenabulum gondwanense]|uniref:Putative oxidoreductase YdhV n=1 Tax=Thermovenabulum gondwanense TaxID=520767 RepID=A0A162N0B7_9FIRM|nr:aldehyde ferredoxin oxidoreductase family protein [Thermovenabulum gondwanense]KYO68626.1 putative oxidoreductase YdhV [Thermovenabulum gondwanense]
MIYGYNKKLLRVNLTDEKFTVEGIDDSTILNFIGGRGFVAKYLYDEIKKGVNPLSEENKIIIAIGPLSGSFLPSSGKIEFGSKSPLTGGYGDSNMGGHIAAELKLAGYDAVIIEGKCESPKVLVIENEKIKLIDGTKYWGKGAITCEKMLKEDLGEEYQIATIGPAGENLVKFSCISHDFGRQAGRTGIAAVMGFKKLKAIAIRGNKTVPVKDPDKLLEKGKEMYNEIYRLPAFKTWTPYGTADITQWVNDNGAFPTKNFSMGYFEGASKLTGQKLRETIHVLDKGCFSCPIPCGKYSRVRYSGKEAYVEGPEYETIALIGGNCMIDDIEKVGYINFLMDEYGIDTISGGNVIAFALECFEKGVINKDDCDGKELKFGDMESVIYLIEKIVKREGIGDVLANGVRNASKTFGKGSENYAIHVKGLEVSGYEPRNAAGMLLAYMTCDIGAHHNRAWAITYDIAVGRYEVEGKAEKIIELQHIRPMIDSLNVCRFPWIELGFQLHHYKDVFKYITGIEYEWEDLLRVGEREYNLTRAFNFREIDDFGRKYDYPPARFYKEELKGEGPTAGQKISFETIEKLLDKYYELRGWDSNGRPTRKKLEELNLKYVADELGL